MLKTLIMKAALIAFVGSISFAAHAIADTQRFDVPAGDLIVALESFAKQADVDLVYQDEQVKGLRTGGVSGTFSPRDAVMKLLEGTPLQLRTDEASGALLITTPLPSGGPAPSSTSATDENPPKAAAGADGGAVREKRSFWNWFRLAQAETNPSAQDVRREESRNSDNSSRASAEAEKSRIVLGEMTVTTGTLIAGAAITSPLFVYNQEDFDLAGAMTAQDFLATLPQNFGGSQSDDTATDLSLSYNPSFGTAVDLRGQGTGSTLVLINGHRVAPGGSADYVDVSMIPLSAVERIEVLTDGASAAYGSDAIGGVVNFIMRDSYQGIDTRLRFGKTTQGGRDERQLVQSLGTNWASGGVVLSYQFLDQEELTSLDRDYAHEIIRPLSGPRLLMPSQRSNSAYLSAQQDLFSGAQVSANVLYTKREAEYTDWDAFGGPTFDGEFTHSSADVQQYGGALGVSVQLNPSWLVEVSGALSRYDTDVVRTSPSEFGGAGPLPYEAVSELKSGDLKLTGDLLRLPGGDVKLAIGGEYRTEYYRFDDSGFSAPENSQYSHAFYGELLVPVFGAEGGALESQALVMSLAGRYEDYSAYGNTFDPKFGLRWNAADGLSFRGTYGTSFKAPNLRQTSAIASGRFLVNVATPSATVRSLLRTGPNPDLIEETATTWTTGIEWAPAFLPGFSTTLSYYDIDYEDRITSLQVNQTTLLNDPIYVETVTRRGDIPDAEFDALAAAVIGSAPLSGCNPPTPGPCMEPVSNIGAILDRRITNISAMVSRGIDWTLEHHFDTQAGAFDWSLNATYQLDYDQKITDVAPALEFGDTAGNPVDLRARAGASWSRGGWVVATSINYTDDYTNARSVTSGGTPLPPAGIDSWTTVDLIFAYEADRGGATGWLSGVRMALNVMNLFDDDPPFYDDGTFGVGFDPTNADAMGRAISLRFDKRWLPH